MEENQIQSQPQQMLYQQQYQQKKSQPAKYQLLQRQHAKGMPIGLAGIFALGFEIASIVVHICAWELAPKAKNGAGLDLGFIFGHILESILFAILAVVFGVIETKKSGSRLGIIFGTFGIVGYLLFLIIYYMIVPCIK